MKTFHYLQVFFSVITEPNELIIKVQHETMSFSCVIFSSFSNSSSIRRSCKPVGKVENEMDSQTGKIKDARLHLSETFLPSHRLAEININVLLIQVDCLFNFGRTRVIQPTPNIKNLPERYTPSSLRTPYLQYLYPAFHLLRCQPAMSKVQ